MRAPKPRYIWSDSDGSGLNRYVFFRHVFNLGRKPRSARLHIFADTRYRLTVNGVLVAHGPARFFVSRPEYDTHDLEPHLRRGRNAIAVAVNSYGCYTYHSEHSIGGLIAWGEATDQAGRKVKLATDETWKALQSPWHEPETTHLSFVLNPGELVDARRAVVGWEAPDFDDAAWPHAVALKDQAHWGELVPRSIPLLDEREVLPLKRSGTWSAQYVESEQVYSFIVVARDGRNWRADAPGLAMTYLHSPQDQEVTFGAWDGKYWVNGEELQPRRRSDMHMRCDFAARLKKGWNSFQVLGRLLCGGWEFQLGLPRQAGLAVSAERDEGSPHTFLVGGPWEGELRERSAALSLPLASPDDLPERLGPWRKWPRGSTASSPYAERAWKKTVAIPGSAALEVNGADHAADVRDGTLVLTFDFGTEVLGRPVLDMSAAAGTAVDLMYSEKVQDGMPSHYSRYEVRMAERYTARQGRQTWRLFHPRGFRYLEVLVTGDLKQFRLSRVSATRANYPVGSVGSFQCSDPVLNAIWAYGPPTLHACMEDAYLDCPRRERGSYAGDNLVQFYTDMAVFGDTRMMRRCVEQIFLSQDASGMLSPCAHSPHRGRHPDYSAITVQGLWHYYARTGDADFLREMEPRLTALMEALKGFEVPELGLLDGSHLQPYLDLCLMDRQGISCTLNCFYQRAFHDAALVMGVLRRRKAAAVYRHTADRLAAAIRRHYWDKERGVFVDRLKAHAPSTGPSVPANVLPLLYDIADKKQAPGALQYVTEAMLNNFRLPEPQSNTDCNVTSYFSFYALGVLYRYGRVREAEQFIRTCWGRMLDKGAHTCWEYFIDRYSQCHAWSTSPTHYLSTSVLGITFPEPGNPNRVRIQPQPGSLSWAEGVYPHPLGPLCVRWQVKGDCLLMEVGAPRRLMVETAERP